MTDLTGLLARCEAATDFDRELDRAIGFAIDGWKTAEITRTTGVVSQMIDIHGDLYPDHPGSMYPAFTESIDAALALVERMLPGAQWGRDTESGEIELWYMTVPQQHFREWMTASAKCSTVPLSILVALLKALQKKQSGE
jgi:hypothetical protein